MSAADLLDQLQSLIESRIAANHEDDDETTAYREGCQDILRDVERLRDSLAHEA